VCQEPVVVALVAFKEGPRPFFPTPRKGPPQTEEGPADSGRPDQFPAAPSGEELVADARGRLSPAQMVQEKLAALMGRSAFPISHAVVALHGVGRRRSVGAAG
jgi:hypothetical protein